MLEKNDIKIIKEIINDAFDTRMKRIEKDMAGIKKDMATKEDWANLEMRMDLKLDDIFKHLKSMILEVHEDLNSLIKRIKKINTEDVIAVNDDVQNLKKRISELELKINVMEEATA